jgi:hypothetical protein
MVPQILRDSMAVWVFFRNNGKQIDVGVNSGIGPKNGTRAEFDWQQIGCQV